MNLFKKDEKRKGLIGTLLFHAALLVVFIFFGLTYTYPPEQEGSVMVDFGYHEQGLGEVENEVEEIVQEEVEPVESNETPTTPTEAVEEVVTQEEVETVTIEKKEKEKEEEPEPKVEKEPTPSNELMKAFEKESSTEAQKTGSQGNTPGKGKMGDPSGKPGTENYDGGEGNGNIEIDLGGRKMVQRPKVQAQFSENSKVVVSITVDRYGNVTKATGGVRGSTTTNANLIKIAEDAAKKTKFNANPKAAEEQTGTMTFIFILK